MTTRKFFVSRYIASIATIIAAIIGVIGLFAVEIYKSKIWNSETHDDDATKMTEIAPSAKDVTYEGSNGAGLSFREVLDTLSDRRLSKLQLQKFVTENKGRLVTWKVRVMEVTPAFESMDDSDIYVIFNPLKSDKTIREVSLAKFGREKESELSALSEGDIAIIQGNLNFNYISSWSVSLKNPEILKFTGPN